MITKSVKCGDSFSLGFHFKSPYILLPTSNLLVYVGGVLVGDLRGAIPPITVNGIYYGVFLSSEETYKMRGYRDIVVVIDDPTSIGVNQNIIAGLSFEKLQPEYSSTTNTDGYNMLIELDITESQIIGNVDLYNALRGPKGDPGASGGGDMYKSVYDPNNLGYVDKALKDSDDNAINTTYQKKEDGKGLSTNDFTTALKNKLDSITAIFTTELKTAYDACVTWVNNATQNVKDIIGIADGGSSNKFLNEQGDFLEIQTAGGGSSGASVFLSNVNSDIAGYKTLSYTPDLAETTKTIVANNGTVSGEAYLFPLPIGLDYFPVGTIDFGAYLSVSSTSGSSYMLIDFFVRSTNGTEQLIDTFTSESIENTNIAQALGTRIHALGEAIDPLGRFGCRVKFQTTRSTNTTLTYIVGDCRAIFFKLPVPLAHSELRRKNEELSFQHFDSTSEKTTPILADSLGLWDSETSTFKKLSWTNLLVSLRSFLVGKVIFPYAIDSAVTDAVTGTDKIVDSFPIPFTLTDVYVNLKSVAAEGLKFTVDVKKNGTSIFSTLITIDSTEDTSKTASVPYVLVSSPTTFLTTDKVSVDIVQVGTTIAGKLPIIYFIGYETI